MKHQVSEIKVEQSIRYNPYGQENFKYSSQADYYSLRTYKKLVFKDLNQQSIQLKWWRTAPEKDYILELTQDSGRLVFNPKAETHAIYNSSQGQWQMTVRTLFLEIGDQIILSYVLIMDDKEVGTYDFQLIFID